MKKILFLIIFMLFPFMVIAKNYNVNDLNLQLDLSDDYIVLIRDNLDENEGLEKLGITKEYMKELMEKSSIYADIIPNDISYEILVVSPEIKLTINNLKNVTDDILDSLRKQLSNKVNADNSSIYKGKYHFVLIDYYDANSGYYIYNYYTVVNARGYNFQLQKMKAITNEEKDSLKKIIDSVDIQVLDEYQKETEEVQKQIDNYRKGGFNWKRVIIYSVVGAVVGGLSSFIILLIRKRRSK